MNSTPMGSSILQVRDFSVDYGKVRALPCGWRTTPMSVS